MSDTQASRVRSLRDAKNIYGDPRFYPPGKHPANARMRAQYAELQKLHDFNPTDESAEALAYLERKMAEFEAGEAAAKLDWLARYSKR